MDITEFINNFGFPVACVIACGWFIYRLWEQQTVDKEKLYTELAQCRKINEEAIRTIGLYAEKLDDIKSDVKEIKELVSN